MAKQPPPDVKCHCSACNKNASAPPGKTHRHCTKKPKGEWIAGTYTPPEDKENAS